MLGMSSSSFSSLRSEATRAHRPRVLWRGSIHPTDTEVPCQSVRVYGDSKYLIGNIPEDLTILGRLRLGDLWDYVQESLLVRDVLLLTLTSSASNTDENEAFSQYVDLMQTSQRAAVISKCLNSSCIRDMYVLAADTKECPASVRSALMLPTMVDSKLLFLVIIGTGRRTTRAKSRSNENLLPESVTYKPIALQDPRLTKSRDPRLNKTTMASNNTVAPTSPSTSSKLLLQ